MKLLFKVGSCDYFSEGKNNKVEIEINLVDGRLSISGGIWDHKKYDYLSAGQNLDEIHELFKDDELVNRIWVIWKKYHLNDMVAGSPKQMEYLSDKDYRDYDEALELLKSADLQPDESFLYNGEPYSYGSAWLKEEIPQNVLDEILSWKSDPRVSSV